jgi:endo-alpha-N-acetylgalactosaminidase
VYVSADGTTWGSPAATGTWANTTAEQAATFSPRTGRYLRLRSLSAAHSLPWASAAELNVAAAAPPARAR